MLWALVCVPAANLYNHSPKQLTPSPTVPRSCRCLHAWCAVFVDTHEALLCVNSAQEPKVYTLEIVTDAEMSNVNVLCAPLRTFAPLSRARKQKKWYGG